LLVGQRGVERRLQFVCDNFRPPPSGDQGCGDGMWLRPAVVARLLDAEVDAANPTTTAVIAALRTATRQDRTPRLRPA
jgi:hypothetical protein